ncbi:YbaB/EbfC family nucleoid-associated protein [Streptosporangium amethystogenes subsp. fukuiense]|uniref:YbaB/EbfC family nucleoid-associated protein n=1 Tax=Streptosporangium amethystogenes subsp. fukuiense TaxID=698418 RepID=A0ABW2TCC7_9ACTN
MTELGNFANIDIDKLLKSTDGYLARMESVRKSMATLVGHAQDEDGLVRVEYAGDGLRELELHPKAMRLSSSELSEKIKEAVRDAAQDLQKQTGEVMEGAFGEEGNPMKYMNDPDAVLDQVREMETAYNRTFEDVMGELDRISRRLDL